MIDYIALLSPERGVAKHFLENFERTGHGEDGVRQSVSAPILPTTHSIHRLITKRQPTLANWPTRQRSLKSFSKLIAQLKIDVGRAIGRSRDTQIHGSNRRAGPDEHACTAAPDSPRDMVR